jgi:hypothetical protein
VLVVLPALQNEFHIARAAASLHFNATLLGFACGGLMMHKLVDPYGVMVPVVLGFGLAAQATSSRQFARVFAKSRDYGCDLRERELSRRRAVAADHAASGSGLRIAEHLRKENSRETGPLRIPEQYSPRPATPLNCSRETPVGAIR